MRDSLHPRRIYRRCQECGIVSRASTFRRVPATAVSWDRTAERVRCPGCGYIGRRVEFPTAEGPDSGAT
jgi:hypothetical protein